MAARQSRTRWRYAFQWQQCSRGRKKGTDSFRSSPRASLPWRLKWRRIGESWSTTMARAARVNRRRQPCSGASCMVEIKRSLFYCLLILICYHEDMIRINICVTYHDSYVIDLCVSNMKLAIHVFWSPIIFSLFTLSCSYIFYIPLF